MAVPAAYTVVDLEQLRLDLEMAPIITDLVIMAGRFLICGRRS